MKSYWLTPLALMIFLVFFVLGYLPLKPIVIATNSMFPKIKSGDVVLVSKISFSNIKINDIIQYKINDYTVIHRVQEIKKDFKGEDYLVMKGDNNQNVDLYPVLEEQVLGSVKLKIPFLGYPTLILNKLINGPIEDTVIVELGGQR